MASADSPTDEKQKGNPILGCGCLIVVILLIGGLAVSCFGGSDEPAGQLPAAAPPTATVSTSPPTSVFPTSSNASPLPDQSGADRDCADFSSQVEAQTALLPGDPEQLDPDGDGLACENYFASQNRPDTDVPSPRAPEDDDSGETRPRSGNSGHPCVSGERDGDGDGYCGES